MAWDEGTFTRYINTGGAGQRRGPDIFQQLNLAGIGDHADNADASAQDLAEGINLCLAKDGQNSATADLPMGGNKHTGVGDGSARAHYASLGQLQDGDGGSFVSQVTVTGERIIITPSPPVLALVKGMRFRFILPDTPVGIPTIVVSTHPDGDRIRLRGAGMIGNHDDIGSNRLVAGDLIDVTYLDNTFSGRTGEQRFILMGA